MILALGAVLCGVASVSLLAADPNPDAAGIEFFEKSVRPVLADNCFKCHGPVKQFAELRLDSRKAMLEGGDTGPAIVPGKPEKSLLVDAINHGDVQMPPKSKLKDAEIAAIEHWVKIGAPWPAEVVIDLASVWKSHWAFQPVRSPTLPSVKEQDWVRNPVDRFVLARLEADGLSHSPAASRRDLIRRVTYDLIGLPPTDDEVRAFENDADPNAYARLVERLLASPQYGEHWARLWLDVARYSDTKGYVYAREEKVFIHAATYRDWVVKAFNENLRYDRFLQLQIAADAVAADSPADLAAMGYLTLGRRFLGVTPDIVDDRIDVVCRGMLGLTVGCARCHDHKYDPIPTADYYSLYGVFQNCTERNVQIGEPVVRDEAYLDFEAELFNRQQAHLDAVAISRGEVSDRVRERITDYFIAQTEPEKYHDENFDIFIEKSDVIPLVVRRFEAYLASPERANDPLFVPWKLFAALPSAEFSKLAPGIITSIQGPDGDAVHPEVRRMFEKSPASMREVAERYGQFFAERDRDWKQVPAGSVWNKVRLATAMWRDSQSAAVLNFLYAPGSPCELPREHISTVERMVDNPTCDMLWKMQGNVDRWINQSPNAPPFAVTLTDKATLTEQRIFKRGNPSTKGETVPRRFLQALSPAERKPFSHGSGRLDLAEAIADPKNPLTARVWVNRVWAQHFGAGLVRTPSDFGIRAEAPSHPELLDWLATQFVDGGWNTKELHRLIVLSNVYQQSSNSGNLMAARHDPQNRLLWRMNPHRLTFEELRDTWLAAGGDLDLREGGRSTKLFEANPPHRRRTLYGYIDRQFMPTVLRMFDVANPDLHSPQRSETTVPQQALFAMNHPFAADRARSIATRLSEDPEQMIRECYHRILQRDPAAHEIAQCVAFVQNAGQEQEQAPPPGAEDWQYGYGEVDVAAGKLKSFAKLPHFTGEAWQGGPNWPDSTLGWVQITASGGHAGNDLQHAAIRRWIAPRAMRVSIASLAQHEVKAGDGVKCWIISSRQGVLQSQVVHKKRIEMNVASLDVEPGDTLDFVVDFNANLNNDQHLWSPVIRELGTGSSTSSQVWDAEPQFGAKPAARLTPREQLVQVLLLSNEVMFVD